MADQTRSGARGSARPPATFGLAPPMPRMPAADFNGATPTIGPSAARMLSSPLPPSLHHSQQQHHPPPLAMPLQQQQQQHSFAALRVEMASLAASVNAAVVGIQAAVDGLAARIGRIEKRTADRARQTLQNQKLVADHVESLWRAIDGSREATNWCWARITPAAEGVVRMRTRLVGHEPHGDQHNHHKDDGDGSDDDANDTGTDRGKVEDERPPNIYGHVDDAAAVDFDDKPQRQHPQPPSHDSHHLQDREVWPTGLPPSRDSAPSLSSSTLVMRMGKNAWLCVRYPMVYALDDAGARCVWMRTTLVDEHDATMRPYWIKVYDLDAQMAFLGDFTNVPLCFGAAPRDGSLGDGDDDDYSSVSDEASDSEQHSRSADPSRGPCDKDPAATDRYPLSYCNSSQGTLETDCVSDRRRVSDTDDERKITPLPILRDGPQLNAIARTDDFSSDDDQVNDGDGDEDRPLQG